MMSNKVLAAIGIVAVVIILGAVAVYEMDEDTGSDYNYTITEVREVRYASGVVEVRAEVDFSPALAEGVILTSSYHGIDLGDYTTTRDGVTHLSLIIYPTPTMDYVSLESGMIISFS